MSEKIFGEIQSTEELNELAVNLRKGKEFDEIRLLCSENNISEDVAEEFIQGKRLHLEAPDREDGEAPSMVARMDKVVADLKEDYLEAKKEARRLKAMTDQEEKDEGEDEGPVTPMGKTIEAIEQEAFERATNSEAKTEKPDAVPRVDYTIEDVRKKLEDELKIYRDGDSKYVVEKLIEKCETDKDLLNAIMLPHKSYDKAFQYFFQKSKTVGYRMPRGNMVYLDNDSAVKLSIEYFKRDDAAEEKKKKQAKQAEKTPAAQKKAAPPKDKGKTKKEIPDKAKAAPEKPKQEAKPKQEPRPKQKNEMDGQMSLFDF